MRPLIIAHRGASNLAPENTLASFRLAKELGADGVECDVQLTKDHKLVIAHDFFTDAHTGVKGDIYDMTFDELRQLDFGKWKSPEYEGEKIPTIEEVLDIGKDMKMMHIELKPYLDRDADFPERVIDAVVNAHMEDKVILTSFQYGLLGRVKEIRPEIRTAALFLNTESSLCPPTALWEDLGLTNGDPLLEELSGPQGLTGNAKVATFTVGICLILFTLFIVLNLIRSRHGRAIMAIRDNRIAAESIGLSAFKYKMIAFTTSAALTGMAGALFAMNYAALKPSKFDFNTSILILVYVVLGGMGNILGSILATVVLYVLPELPFMRGLGNYRMLIYAVLLIGVMLMTQSSGGKRLQEQIKGFFAKLFKKKGKGGESDE